MSSVVTRRGRLSNFRINSEMITVSVVDNTNPAKSPVATQDGRQVRQFEKRRKAAMLVAATEALGSNENGSEGRARSV